jgi:hypothetical protein
MDSPPPSDQEASELGRHLAELGPSTGGAVGGALVGVAFGGVPGAVIGAAAGEVAAYVAHEALAHRRQRAATAVEVAATEADLTPEELLERIRADERLLELAATVIAAAAETALQAKIRALGQALARGTLATDDAQIDQERFMVDTLAGLEAPHLRALHQVSQRYDGYGTDRTPDGTHQAYGWTFETLREHQPGMATVLGPVLARLISLDVIANTAVGTRGHIPGETDRWVLTDHGRRVLDLLEERGSEGPSRQPM